MYPLCGQRETMIYIPWNDNSQEGPVLMHPWACVSLQEEEEAVEGEEEAEGEGGAEDGPARCLHRRQRGHGHVLSQ